MKKIISLLVAVACIMTTGSIHAQNAIPAPLTPSDSASILMGQVMGHHISRDLDRETLSAAVKGIETGMTMDGDSAFMVGVMVGLQLKQEMKKKANNGLVFNTDLFIENLKKICDSDTMISQEELWAKDNQTRVLLEKIKEAKYTELANTPEALAVKENGERFIAKKLISHKYTRTATGLMYRIITPGKGENFNINDYIVVKYKGSLVNGTLVEDSDGETVRCPKDVTPGCQEMLMLMKPGMKVEAIIPHYLAYGIYGNPDRNIGPNETLVFEIETIGIDEDSVVEIEVDDDDDE